MDSLPFHFRYVQSTRTGMRQQLPRSMRSMRGISCVTTAMALNTAVAGRTFEHAGRNNGNHVSLMSCSAKVQQAGRFGIRNPYLTLC